MQGDSRPFFRKESFEHEFSTHNRLARTHTHTHTHTHTRTHSPRSPRLRWLTSRGTTACAGRLWTSTPAGAEALSSRLTRPRSQRTAETLLRMFVSLSFSLSSVALRAAFFVSPRLSRYVSRVFTLCHALLKYARKCRGVVFTIDWATFAKNSRRCCACCYYLCDHYLKRCCRVYLAPFPWSPFSHSPHLSPRLSRCVSRVEALVSMVSSPLHALSPTPTCASSQPHLHPNQTPIHHTRLYSLLTHSIALSSQTNTHARCLYSLLALNPVRRGVVPVYVLCNKQDLLTATPVATIKSTLESEMYVWSMPKCQVCPLCVLHENCACVCVAFVNCAYL